MLDKYYTPEIEEFHEGFEFEQKGKTTEFKVKIGENGEPVKCSESIITTGWITDKYDVFAFTETKYISEIDKVTAINTLDDCLNSGEIRVKYLDEQDILDLGFKEDTYNGVKCFTKNNCQIFFFPHNIMPDCNIVSIDLFAGEFRNQYFRGLVKNKSELKIILKQIANGI